MATVVQDALKQHYSRSQRWGFRWALWTAILWGAWYIPGTALWYESPYQNIPLDDQRGRLVATAVMTWLHAFFVLAFLVVWNGVLGKLSDFGRTIIRIRTISKWYAIASLFGGPMAIFGSYLAMGFVGPVFAAVTSLFYPVIGAVVARLWFKEKITTQSALGITIIIFGGIVVYGPSLIGNINDDTPYAWIGYLGGILSAVGWGMEGAFAARGMDTSDPDVGIQCRFSFEAIFWTIVLIPLWFLNKDLQIIELACATLKSSIAMIWMTLAAACHAFSYTAFYKCFPLIGVSRGEAVANLHGIFAVIFVLIFTLQWPEWYFLLGLAIAMLGSYIMFREPAESLAQLRDVTTKQLNS